MSEYTRMVKKVARELKQRSIEHQQRLGCAVCMHALPGRMRTGSACGRLGGFEMDMQAPDPENACKFFNLSSQMELF